MTRRGVVFGLAVSAMAAACTIMNGLELPAASNAGDGGASSSGGNGRDGGGLGDGQVGRSPDGGPGCALKHAPPKPAPAGGTDSATPIEVALATMLADNNSAPLGYDLDDRCTCPDAPPCVTKGSPVCDYNNDGTDNAGASISKDLSGVFNPINTANQRITSGQTGFLVRLANYNLQPNDEAVAVTIFRSKGVADGNGVNFNEKQPWPASARTSVSTAAWVNGSTLVAQFDAVEVPFLDPVPNPAKMQHAMLVGQLVAASGGGMTMQAALLVGRVSTNDMIASIGQLEVQNGSGFYVCQASSEYQAFGSATCLVQDINLDPAADSAGTASCDALSITVSMTFVPATIVAPVAIPPAQDQCAGQPAIQCN